MKRGMGQNLIPRHRRDFKFIGVVVVGEVKLWLTMLYGLEK